MVKEASYQKLGQAPIVVYQRGAFDCATCCVVCPRDFTAHKKKKCAQQTISLLHASSHCAASCYEHAGVSRSMSNLRLL